MMNATTPIAIDIFMNADIYFDLSFMIIFVISLRLILLAYLVVCFIL